MLDEAMRLTPERVLIRTLHRGIDDLAIPYGVAAVAGSRAGT